MCIFGSCKSQRSQPTHNIIELRLASLPLNSIYARNSRDVDDFINEEIPLESSRPCLLPTANLSLLLDSLIAKKPIKNTKCQMWTSFSGTNVELTRHHRILSGTICILIWSRNMKHVYRQFAHHNMSESQEIWGREKSIHFCGFSLWPERRLDQLLWLSKEVDHSVEWIMHEKVFFRIRFSCN